MKPQAVDTVYFAFENDFVDTFRCIPMIVRYKLDAPAQRIDVVQTPGCYQKWG